MMWIFSTFLPKVAQKKDTKKKLTPDVEQMSGFFLCFEYYYWDGLRRRRRRRSREFQRKNNNNDALEGTREREESACEQSSRRLVFEREKQNSS